MTKWHAFLPGLAVALCMSLNLCVKTFADPEEQTPNPLAKEFAREHLEFFEKNVRPLLVNRCHECHGEEEGEREAGLRLDSRKEMLAGGQSGPTIVPGKPEQSLLIEAIHYGDTFEMPPDSKLSEQEIATLTKWIRIGAPWSADIDTNKNAEQKAVADSQEEARYWCWNPIQQQSPPEVKNRDWPLGDVDRFILRALEDRDLSPAPPANPYHWIRRVSFDLTGLPPTPEEVDAFINDSSTEARERVVDRLLASPRFGEHWARYWMDLVRYGETKAFAQDYAMPFIYRYRDYLIRAYNEDVPYDKFIMEALAGDLLETPRLNPSNLSNESVMGPGFIYLTDGHHGPADIHADEARVFDTIIDTTSKAFTALTLSCCRCHDHKFDELTASDYYSLYGVLASSRLDYANAVSPEKLQQSEAQLKQQKELIQNELFRSLRQQIDALDLTDRAKLSKEWQTLLYSKEKLATSHPLYPMATIVSAADESQRKQLWNHLASAPAESVRDEVPESLAFEHWFPSGTAFANTPLKAGTFVLAPDGETIINTFIGGSVAAGEFSSRFAGSFKSPTFVLPEKISLRVKGRQGHVRLYVQHYEMVGHGPTTTELDIAINNDQWHWVEFDTRLWKGKRGYLELLHNGREMRFFAKQQHMAIHQDDSYLACNQVLLSQAPEVEKTTTYSAAWNIYGKPPADLATAGAFFRDQLLQLLTRWESGILQSDEQDILESLCTAEGPLATTIRPESALGSLVQTYRQTVRGIPTPFYVRSMTDGHGEDEPIYIRGNPHVMNRTATPRHFLEAIDGEAFTGSGSGRKEWAAALVDRNNPLVSRVEVNRIWYRLFGRGIVKTVDNFGEKGDAPSHPELLDYLAADFMKNDWSRKSMIRKLVLSNTYQMSTKGSAAATEIDPDNIFLQHMKVRRIPAEAIRDAILATSGSLNDQMYGPSVPVNLNQTQPSRARPDKSGPLDGDGRRTVYQEMRRNYLPPLLLVFDLPQAAVSAGQRGVTNVPAQSLALLNDPFVVEQAGLWANKVLQDKQHSTEDRIHSIHHAAFSRPATDREIDRSKRMLSALAQEHQLDEKEVTENEQVWKDFCHMMLNRKEFIFLQ
ncbi:MAG: PSD1 and planctomycete cytochrome C domain-containing protein [Pirellulales bacterium]|nr:PSD1 and planctomycete cytochrome C domain-containing protein [Pirellulales bacterium]